MFQRIGAPPAIIGGMKRLLTPLVLVALTTSAPAAPAGSMREVAAARLADARALLGVSLEALGAAPSKQELARVHRAMEDIQAGLDAYFHGPAPTDPAGKSAMAAMRREVMFLLGGPEPSIVVAEDVLRFRPALHRRLAGICRQLGEFRRAIEHLRAAQAVEGTRAEDLQVLVADHRALGDGAGAAAVEAELRAFRAQEAATARP